MGLGSKEDDERTDGFAGQGSDERKDDGALRPLGEARVVLPGGRASRAIRVSRVFFRQDDRIFASAPPQCQQRRQDDCLHFSFPAHEPRLDLAIFVEKLFVQAEAYATVPPHFAKTLL